MPKIDPKRTIGLIVVIGLVVLGYMFFSGGGSTPAIKEQPTISLAGVKSAPASTAGSTLERKPLPSTPQPVAIAESNQAGVEAKKGPAVNPTEPFANTALPDPFRGASAELIRLRKEAELLDANVKILDLKTKQAEAELKQKRAKTLAAMIEKDPKILFSLPQDAKDGGLTLPPPSASRTPPADEISIQEIVRARTPTVRMVILGRDKRVTIDYRGETFTLAVGDKFQDMEVLNITARGALFKIQGKNEFVPVAEKTNERGEEKPSAKPGPNTARPS